MKKTILIVAAALSLSRFGYAQDGYNPLSIRPTHTSDVMYQKTVTRALDLREKCNENPCLPVIKKLLLSL